MREDKEETIHNQPTPALLRQRARNGPLADLLRGKGKREKFGALHGAACGRMHAEGTYQDVTTRGEAHAAPDAGYAYDTHPSKSENG